MAVPGSNPFSTRFTQPGRITPLDAAGRPLDAGVLLARLRILGGTAAVVGPHGSGKSTLLSRLAHEIERGGGRLQRLRLRSWSDTASSWSAILRAGPGSVVCIDSWECLGIAARSLMRTAAIGRRCGLLVTSHKAAGMPVLMRCDTSLALLHSIVAGLPGHDHWYGTLIHAADVESAYVRQRGNLRESLYELYDRFEFRARRGLGACGSGPADDDGSVGERRGIHEFADGFSYPGAPEHNLRL
ncbi:MAG: hypothetical protein HQ464_16825 [Planctomycetes bacterium]|nr:hypothetical protein [Planctomycetota bacterium]